MCYKKFDSRKNFLDAEQHCRNEGGHLARISSDAENELVGAIGGDGMFWIGLWSGETTKCYRDSNRWVWTDGTPSTGFNRWGNAKSGQKHNPPDCWDGEGGLSQGMGAIFNYPYQNNRWEDTSIVNRMPFVCGKSAAKLGKGDALAIKSLFRNKIILLVSYVCKVYRKFINRDSIVLEHFIYEYASCTDR